MRGQAIKEGGGSKLTEEDERGDNIPSDANGIQSQKSVPEQAKKGESRRLGSTKKNSFQRGKWKGDLVLPKTPICLSNKRKRREKERGSR